MTLAPFVKGGNAPGSGPLRDNGVSVGALPSSKANLPSTECKAVERQKATLEMSRDAFAGQSVLHAKSTQYLPAGVGEGDNYGARLKRSLYFNMYRTAIDSMVGFIMRKPPVLGADVPEVMRQHLENADMAGTHIDVLLRDELQDAMIAGHGIMGVEYSDTGGAPLTLGDEQALGLRPYWVTYRKDQVVSFREGNRNGQTYLAQIVLKETTMVPDGAYGEKEQVRYRVRYDENGVVGWRLEEVTAQNTIAIVAEGLYVNQEEIPLTEVPTSGKVARFESRPALEDVVYLNLAHYQQYSDYATYLHKTSCPILTISGGGEAEGPIVVGPNTSFNFTDPSASAAYVSHDGASLDNCEKSLENLKGDIATASVAMLASQKRMAETAKAKEIDKGATDSKLAVTARGLEDATERCLQWHAKYLKLPSGGSITINREFTDQTMVPELLTALAGVTKELKLPRRILLKKMQQGGLIDDGEDLEVLDGEMESAEADAMADAMELAQGAKPAPVVPSETTAATKKTLQIQRDEGGRMSGLIES